MPLNTDGGLLEGIRVATGNNSFTYSPRSVITNQGALDSIQYPSEYMIFVGGQAQGDSGIDIGSPSLVFYHSKNIGNVIRFDFDAFARRWNTSPGSSPDDIGILGNSPRLVIPIPDTTIPFSDAPYYIYIGYPTRIVTFTISTVQSSMDFTDPPAGTVELSLESGELNFGSADLANVLYIGGTVNSIRQSFFDRSKSLGIIGSLPDNSISSYKLLLNPIPGTGQTPRIRIGYRNYLIPIPYATELLILIPPSGSVAYSVDTGRVVFAPSDIDAFATENVYYDGVVNGQGQLTQTPIGPTVSYYPSVCGTFSGFVNPSDQTRYVLFIDPPSGPRYYLKITFFSLLNSLPTAPRSGEARVETLTGSVYISFGDFLLFPTGQVKIIDTYLQMESGVSIQVYKSASNISKFEKVPDFVEFYFVEDQIIQSGIGSPFVRLPTIPLVDSTLSYSILPSSGGGGTFTGPLVDGSDESQLGIGYLLDLDSKQIKFSRRKTTSETLIKSTSILKLEGQAISPLGFSASKNNIPISPGIDFDFNPEGGLVEFVEPVGENDPRNVLGVSGSTVLPNRFQSSESVFSAQFINSWIIISSGSNAGMYQITSFVNSFEVLVSENFQSANTESVDIRFDVEIVADRFFVNFRPEFRKITVERASSLAGPFTVLTSNDFTVITQTGQINIVKPASPGEVFKVSYIWLKSDDNGITVNPTPVTEYAAFKIRQETATTTPGTGIINFNPDGKTVSTTQPITLYIDGVTIDPKNFVFTAPGTITVPNSLTTEDAILNYFVNEAPGGNQLFTLVNSPIDLDRAQITSDQADATFNGNVTNEVSVGSTFLSDGKDLFLVSSVSYDVSQDTTVVTFNPIPEIDTGFAPLKVSGPVTGSYSIVETLPADVIPKGTTSVSIQGNAPYKSGTVITLDGDPFLALSAAYDPTTNRTNITLAAKTTRNYIIPLITRTIRPVLNSGTEFYTAKPADMDYTFSLFLDGPSARPLTKGIDFTVAEGGSIQTTFQVTFGNSLYAFYVARTSQPALTNFIFNFAQVIAPGPDNGLQGQKLSSTYNLYSPDTFFYRTQTILSFVPEIVDDLKKSSSSGTSGPNTASVSSLNTKNQGSPSLYFDEQHIENVDVVSRRFLKFYNDVINYYEDILTGLDGRVVGGLSGKFRYNDQSNTVDEYDQITNDIDDKVRVFDFIVLTSLDPFTFGANPAYSFMYESNRLSRIFPNVNQFVTVALNDKVVPTVDLLQTMGSTGISNITSSTTMTSSRAVAKFSSSTISGSSMIFSIQQNGDPETLVPAFAVGQKIFIYNSDGSPFSIVPSSISSITGVGPVSITVSSVMYPNQTGSLVQDTSDTSDPANHFYIPGQDLLINPENGQVLNITFPLPSQTTIVGNELVDCSVTYGNSDIAPKRVPALDGFEFNDNGRISVPPLSRIDKSETYLLAAEKEAIGRIRNGTVQLGSVIIIISSPISCVIGDDVVFLSGPNAGQVRVISLIISTTSFQVASAFPSVDLVGNDIFFESKYGMISNIVNSEISTINTNTVFPPVPPSLVGQVNSELISVDLLIRELGEQQVSGSGSASTINILTDLFTNFTTVDPPITSSSFLYVTSGSGMGLYKVLSVSTNSLILDPTSPYPSLPIGGPYPYMVISPWEFFSEEEFKFAADFLAKTISFYNSTLSWAGSISLAGSLARQAILTGRQTDVLTFIDTISGVIEDDGLYDTRFLWIQQRTDKKNGTLSQAVQAQKRRIENTRKIANDQLLLLITQVLVP